MMRESSSVTNLEPADEKMKRGWAYRRVVRLPTAARSHRGVPSALPALARLGRLYLAARAALPPPPRNSKAAAPQWVFQLPGERRPAVRCMSAWVQTVMNEMNIAAQDGIHVSPALPQMVRRLCSVTQ